MMILLPRNAPTSHTKARVGMLGGFFTIVLYHLARNGEGTYLNQKELGRVGDAPEESAKDREYLLGYFNGCENDERQLSEKGRWLRKVQKVDMRKRKQRRHRFRACNRQTG